MSVQKVTAGDQTCSVFCPSCPCSLCSPLVSASSPPMTATNMWTYLTSSALPCVVLGVSTSMFVVGIVHMCVEGSLHVCVCIHVHMCMYCYCTHNYSINLCHLLHTVIYGCLCVNCQGLSSHMTVTCTNGVTCHHCVCTIIRRHVGDVYLGMSPIKNLCTSSG